MTVSAVRVYPDTRAVFLTSTPLIIALPGQNYCFAWPESLFGNTFCCLKRLDVLPMGLYIPYKQYFFQYVALDCIA